MSIRNTPASLVHHAGFTLIEMMITVVILAIIASIAMPTYTAQILKSHRTEARTAILDLAGREERVLSVNGSYSQVPTDLNYPGTTWGAFGSGYYTLAVTAGTNPATFTITATATGTQANDTSCNSFTVNQLGQQTSVNSGSTDSTSTCWK